MQIKPRSFHHKCCVPQVSSAAAEDLANHEPQHRRVRIHHKSSVPHPCDFFPSQGWDSTIPTLAMRECRYL
jgi:hypothetical protein